MFPEETVDQIEAVQKALNGAVAAGGGVKAGVDLSADLPGSVSGSLAVADALGG